MKRQKFHAELKIFSTWNQFMQRKKMKFIIIHLLHEEYVAHDG